jgi:hypothetical protein
MKLIIYLILFILLLYYLDNKEQFASTKTYKDFNNMNEVNQYDVLKSDKIKSILEYKDLNNIQPNDMDGIDMYKNKLWVIKDKGFSDIYNYESVVTKESGSKDGSSKDSGSKDGATKNAATEAATLVTVAPATSPTDAPKMVLLDKIKSLEIKDKKYKLIGTASNDYYNQYFLLYEREVPIENVNKEFTPDDKFSNYFREKDNMDELKNKAYEYILGKVNKEVPEVVYTIGRRSKINIKDVVYFSLGTFQLGPLIIKPIA